MKTYDEVKKEYMKLYNRFMSYEPGQVGSRIFADKLADLEEEYPEFVERIELGERWKHI